MICDATMHVHVSLLNKLTRLTCLRPLYSITTQSFTTNEILVFFSKIATFWSELFGIILDTKPAL